MKITSIKVGISNEHEWCKFYLEKAIEIAIRRGAKISNTNSEGGYLSSFQSNPKGPATEYVIACGNFPMENTARYFYNSHEKAFRLNVNIPKGHITSRESANEAEGEYPGAYYSLEDGRIDSFSGVKSIWDEFLSILASCVRHCLKRARSFGLEESIKGISAMFMDRFSVIPKDDKLETLIMLDTVDEVVTLRPNFKLVA